MDVMCLRAGLLDVIPALYPGSTNAEPMLCYLLLLLVLSVMFDPGVGDCWRSLAVLRPLLYKHFACSEALPRRIMLLSECLTL